MAKRLSHRGITDDNRAGETMISQSLSLPIATASRSAVALKIRGDLAAGDD